MAGGGRVAARVRWAVLGMVARAGNIESLDPPSASAGTDWRMAGLIVYNTLYSYKRWTCG